MADQKISQLTSATLPLAGTEVLPIVQGGATVKVATGELVVFPQEFAGIKYKSNNTTFNSGNVAVIVADTLGSGSGNLRVETYGGGGGGGTTMEFRGSGDVAASRGNLVIGTSGKCFVLPGGITWTSGAGSPEGVVTAPVGSLYSRSDGGLLTSLYVKQSGSGNTGWAGK